MVISPEYRFRNDELIRKKLEVLKALVPTLSRLAFLREDVIVIMEQAALHDQQISVAARSLGLTVHPITVHRSEELTAAFQSMTTNRDQGLYVMSTPFSLLHLKEIVELAAKHRIVAIYDGRGWVEAGGLVVVRRQFSGGESTHCGVSRQNSQGSQACRPSG